MPKDDHFIANTLDKAGLGFGDDRRNRPSAADWADPSSYIPGWQPVTDGSVQAGDVLATAKPIARSWYNGGGQQLGIATGNGTTIGIVDNDRIGESDWGFKDGHNPTVWRSTPLASTRDPVQSEPLPPPPDYQGCPVSSGDKTRSCPWGSIKDPTGGKDGKIDPDFEKPPEGLIPGSRDRIPTYDNPNNQQITGRWSFDI